MALATAPVEGVFAPAPICAWDFRAFDSLRFDAITARMAVLAPLFMGPLTSRQAAGMFVGVGPFFLGMGALLLLGAVEQSSVPNLLPLPIVVLCLGALFAGLGVVWFRRAEPPWRELAKRVQ
jgi:lipopolysaccharide export LptBFGC system permease protein LptF